MVVATPNVVGNWQSLCRIIHNNFACQISRAGSPGSAASAPMMREVMYHAINAKRQCLPKLDCPQVAINLRFGGVIHSSMAWTRAKHTVETVRLCQNRQHQFFKRLNLVANLIHDLQTSVMHAVHEIAAMHNDQPLLLCQLEDVIPVIRSAFVKPTLQLVRACFLHLILAAAMDVEFQWCNGSRGAHMTIGYYR